MKSFFKIIFMFFVLTIALLSEPSALQAQPVDLTGSIQNIKTETVVLVSNNILGGDIRANTEEETNNISSSTPLVLSFLQQNSNFSKNKTLLKGSFIHNLSTNKQKVQQIRAP